MPYIRFALRTLARNPGFALSAILTLGAGIGASTAIFSAVDAVLMHPLAYPHPEQLVMVTKNMPKLELFKSDASALDFLDYRHGSRSFSQIAALGTNSINLTGSGDPVRVFGLRVSTSLFPMLGVRPLSGRVFRPDEEQAGNDHVAILGEALWKSRFGADPHIAGKTIEIDSQKFTVIGVIQPVLQFIEQAQLYVPLVFTPEQLDPNARGRQNLDVVARLKPGVTLAQARAEMKVVAARMTRNLPEWYPPDWSIKLDPLADSVAGELRAPLLVLLGAVGMVLLIGCVNVAGLLLARATARRKEIGLRIALGAARHHIVRQLLGESVLLAGLAGAAGLLLGAWVIDLFIRFGSPELLRWQNVHINAISAAFALISAMLTSLLFGIAPAWTASNVNINSAIQGGGAAGTPPSSGRLRTGLVIAEVALAVVLLTGAGLLVRSYTRIWQADPGFRRDHLLTARISLPPLEYRDPARVTAFYSELLARIQALPGVRSAGAVDGLPFGAGSHGGGFNIAGRPWPASEAEPDVQKRQATPEYFCTMGIPLKQGRLFTERDHAGTPPVVVIDEALAKGFFPKRDAVGQFLIDPFVSSKPNDAPQIIGIVGSVKHRNLMDAPVATIYHPALQVPSRFMNLAVRTAGDPIALIPAIQEQVHELDRNLPVYKFASMEQNMSDSLIRRRFAMLLLAILAGFALCLSAVGIYGVIAYSVNQRVREIGIRIALGAEAGGVQRLILSQGMRPVLAGLLAGLLISLGAMRALAGLLYGIAPSDPPTMAGVAAVLLATAAVAAYLPARRAARTDPMVALRQA